MTHPRIAIALACAICCLANSLGASEDAIPAKPDKSRPIRVVKPNKLPPTLPAERIHLGQGYKPTMALLPNGELVVMSFFWEGGAHRRGGDYHEYNTLWRSTDLGRTWSVGKRVEHAPGKDFIGREHWLTSIDNGTEDGILFSTCHIAKWDIANPTDSAPSWINRSIDGGRTWKQLLIGPKGLDGPMTRTNRNIVRLCDGRLMFGVAHWSGAPGLINYLWTSTDEGLSWKQSKRLAFVGKYVNYKGGTSPFANGGPFIDETWFDINKEGNLTAYVRLNGTSPLYAKDEDPLPAGSDQVDRTITATSTDGGLTWGNFKDCGEYGQMYARIARLADRRLLLTFTQRDYYKGFTGHLGLRALISHNDGQTWNFDNDLVILDENTPKGWRQGGGFGNTIQLSDGSLISCYSYHNESKGRAKYQTEVVRWALPTLLK